MNARTLGALIALNVALLLALVVTAVSPQPAQGQAFAQANYIMVAGQVAGRNDQAAVYIVELNTARMVSLIYNSANNNLNIIAGKNLLEDMPR